jgi:OmcA/MtrC family decaheme c-type cytochrome
MINEKQTMYLAVVAIILATIGIGLSYYKAEGPMGPVGTAGPAGPAGPTGAAGPVGPAATPVVLAAEPESCSVCHKEAGAAHQESYDELYQDGVITVTDITYTYTAPNTHKVTFKLLMDGEPIDARDVSSSGIYWVPYTGSAFQFEPAADRLTLKGTMSYSAGVSTSTLTGTGAAYSSSLASKNGLIVIYGRDEDMGRLPARVYQTKYPFAGLKETGSVDYVSPANNDGCELCHTDPYLKHGYIYGQVDGDASTDFYTCKACHLDNGEGGHYEWQLLVNDPETAVPWLEDEDTSIFTAAELEELAYKTSLMNDVHMSHAMEFPYPQSMSNCITCHEGKLDMILTADNFNVETCKSCHPVTGSEEYGTADLALKTILPSAIHGAMNLATVDCASCHGAGSSFGEFSDIHSGYDKKIYTADGVKYSEAIVVSIDKASKAGNMVTIEFSATGSAGSVDSADIVPEVMISLYGYDTKDFIVNGHDRYDSSGNGVISRADGDLPKGAYVVGTVHAYFTTIKDTPGSWSVKTDLSEWASLISDGTVKRIEIAVLSIVEDADGEEVAINAVSRTFDIASNGFDDNYFDSIVKVEDGCNNCHEALGTTFHSPDYGGSVTVCRMCHVGLVGGSHLEMQSRSIDSYVHAIHSFQDFDIGDINFDDPVEALHYEHHIGFPYPTHGITDCESCHVAGAYEVPDQTKSLPGILSAADAVETLDRDIGEVPSYVTGPASRACGGCHRAVLIKEDAASELVSFFQHTKMGGYLIEAKTGTLATVIEDIMAYYE